MSDQQQNQPADELKPVEQAMAAFVPAPPRLDRDRLMFLAGAASSLSPAVHGRVRLVDEAARRLLWPAVSAALAATSLALAIALAIRPAPATQIVYQDRIVFVSQPIERSAPPAEHVNRPSPTAAAQPNALALADIPASNFLRTRDVALRLGLDALGSSPAAGGEASPAPSYRDLIQGLSSPNSGGPKRSSPTSQM